MQSRLNTTKEITLAGMIVGIEILIVLLARFFFIGELLILLLFPLLTTFYFFNARFRFLIAYMLASLFISLIISDITALLYVLPALILGAVFAILVKLRMNKFYLILSTTIVNFFLLIFTNYLIKIFYKTDFIKTLEDLLKNSNLPFIYFLLLLISFCQIILTYIIIENELKKFGIRITNIKITPFSYCLPIIFFAGIFIPNNLISISMAIAFIIFFLPLIPDMYSNNKYLNVIIIIQLSSIILALPLINVFPTRIVYVTYLIPILTGIITKLLCFFYGKNKI